ncbi:hypothetical protein BDZ91DRAFT_768097 [Kalaharituber pfeilii]|nr:hypothetical protein BDZ91DRAFT_768097 [Kalaharituber pfeilii]
MTNMLILRHPKLEKDIADRLKCFAIYILERLGPVMKRSKTGERRLQDILKHAGNLAIECEKEPSKFWIYIPRRQEEFKATFMSCVDGIVADTDLENEGALVDFVVSPIIGRGPDTQQVVITKARVAVTRRVDCSE